MGLFSKMRSKPSERGPPPHPRQSHPNILTLDAAFKAYGKTYWGVATDQRFLNQDPDRKVIASDFGQVTPENSMKWLATEHSRGMFNFDEADYLVNWAQANGKLIRGHTLLWHLQLPRWVEECRDKQTLTRIIEDHITAVVSRYRGRIYAWDVCNEVFSTDDGALRSSVFFDVLGQDFIGMAFNAARAADPDAKLYLNDFIHFPAKAAAIIPQVKQWRAAGIPIDGLGIQCHVSAGESRMAVAALQVLSHAAPEIEMAITELDIVGGAPAEYVTVATACLSLQNCVGITSWGLRDQDSWIADGTPLLFDRDWQRKPAYTAVLDALRARLRST